MNKLVTMPLRRLAKHSLSFTAGSRFVTADYPGRLLVGMVDDPPYTVSGSDPVESTPSINFMPIAWSPQLLAMMLGQSVPDFLATESLFPYTGKFAKPGTLVTPARIILYCPLRGLRRSTIESYLGPIGDKISAARILVAKVNPPDLAVSVATAFASSPIIKMFLPNSDILLNSEGVPYPVVNEKHWVGMEVLYLDWVSDYEVLKAGGGGLDIAVPYDGLDVATSEKRTFTDLPALHTELVKRCYPRYIKFGYFCPYYLDPLEVFVSHPRVLSGGSTVAAFAAGLADYGVECPMFDPYDEAAVGQAYRDKVISFFGL
jgi:hypothetical protein